MLYFQPTNSDLDYALVDSNSDQHPQGKTVEVDPSHHFGFNILAGYRFPTTNSDISLNYTYLNTDDSDSVSGDHIWARLAHPDFGGEWGTHAKGTADFDYQAADLLGGYLFHPFNHLNVHTSAGLRYAKLDTTLKALYTGAGDGSQFGPKGTEVKLTNDFSGIGPRVVSNAVYNLPANFGLVAEVGASLLIGTADMSIHQYNYDNDNATTIPAVDVKKSTSTLVPELDAKIGVNYTLQFANQSSLIFDLGWQAINYFDVNGRFQFHDDHEGAFANTLSSVGFNGPYLGATYYA